MITLEQYFGKWMKHPDATQLRKDHAVKLLAAVNLLMAHGMAEGIEFPINPATVSQVSGAEFGGFRPQDCPIGAPGSAHKSGLAVDLWDPENNIDAWCMQSLDKLEECGIYIEHPRSTEHWSHWTIRAPASGNRVFMP